MDIRFFSPSFKRAGNTTTNLAYPFVKLVVHQFEAEAYRKAGADIVIIPDEFQGNIARVRNWILDQNGTADAIIMMDDDVNYVGRFIDSKRKKLKPAELLQFADTAVQMAIDCGAYMFGLNTVEDKGSYREFTPFSFLSPVLGPFHGIRPNTLRYDEQFYLKEDYELFIQHVEAYRRVLRFNFMHYVCDHSNKKGGCATYRNLKREREQFDLLVRKWGTAIVRHDANSDKSFDYNPIVKIPIKGV
ncbi:hypothetical protein BH09BAC4_BH09BAC4_28140 [soil metagenome]